MKSRAKPNRSALELAQRAREVPEREAGRGDRHLRQQLELTRSAWRGFAGDAPHVRRAARRPRRRAGCSSRAGAGRRAAVATRPGSPRTRGGCRASRSTGSTKSWTIFNGTCTRSSDGMSATSSGQQVSVVLAGCRTGRGRTSSRFPVTGIDGSGHDEERTSPERELPTGRTPHGVNAEDGEHAERERPGAPRRP